jgi:pyruvate/2-oxoglutarate dehydrogenase complex dihydrolipoamide dehydrogenase (E3) component
MAQKVEGEFGYDLLVIGGGPAGVTAALRARELGASVALVERYRMGGTCTNDGCVPTRVLAHTARLLREAEWFPSQPVWPARGRRMRPCRCQWGGDWLRRRSHPGCLLTCAPP